MILTKRFKDQFPISFDAFLQEKECMVNATEMGKIFGKLVKDYLKTEKTQEFLKVLEIEIGNSKMSVENDQNLEVQKDARPFETEKTEVANDENSDVQDSDLRLETDVKFSENILKVVKGGRNSGTWMHRYLAIDFAMWLDPYFKYWVISTIEEILFGYARRRTLSFKQTLTLKKEMEALKTKQDPDGNDFHRYISIQTELEDEKTGRRKLSIDENKEIEMILFTEQEMGSKVND